MTCHRCRLPTHDTPVLAYPLLNQEPHVLVGAPGSGAFLVIHAPCWRLIRTLKEKKEPADAPAR